MQSILTPSKLKHEGFGSKGQGIKGSAHNLTTAPTETVPNEPKAGTCEIKFAGI